MSTIPLKRVWSHLLSQQKRHPSFFKKLPGKNWYLSTHQRSIGIGLTSAWIQFFLKSGWKLLRTVCRYGTMTKLQWFRRGNTTSKPRQRSKRMPLPRIFWKKIRLTQVAQSLHAFKGNGKHSEGLLKERVCWIYLGGVIVARREKQNLSTGRRMCVDFLSYDRLHLGS